MKAHTSQPGLELNDSCLTRVSHWRFALIHALFKNSNPHLRSVQPSVSVNSGMHTLGRVQLRVSSPQPTRLLHFPPVFRCACKHQAPNPLQPRTGGDSYLLWHTHARIHIHTHADIQPCTMMHFIDTLNSSVPFPSVNIELFYIFYIQYLIF